MNEIVLNGKKNGMAVLLLLILALVFNLGAIGYFKYAGFFLESIGSDKTCIYLTCNCNDWD